MKSDSVSQKKQDYAKRQLTDNIITNALNNDEESLMNVINAYSPYIRSLADSMLDNIGEVEEVIGLAVIHCLGAIKKSRLRK